MTSPLPKRCAAHAETSLAAYTELMPIRWQLSSARVSLWVEALEPGKPLSFLDAHVKCGNSLLGTTLWVDAYTPQG
jgi:hypothetical protein